MIEKSLFSVRVESMLAGESVDRGGGRKEIAEGIGEKPRGYKWNKLWKIVLSNEVNSKQTRINYLHL